MKVPAFDLREQYAALREELLPLLDGLMSRGQFILGDQVRSLEADMARYTGTAHGVGVANGSDALHLALLACGIGAGDEVIVPAFTFFATAGSVARAGARPVFVDVDPETFNINPDSVRAALSPRTRAIIPVHLYGQAAAMEVITALAAEHGLRVIEDAAQAVGARRNGQPVCTFGALGCLSFFPTKNLGAFGDGGMVVTDDAALAEQVRVLRVHGSKPKYYHHQLGYNSRLDELQAAILRVKLQRLDALTRQRQEAAARYDRMLSAAGVGEHVQTPAVAPGNVHVYHQYTIRAARRDELQAALAAAGVGTAIYYPLPLHRQPVFRELGYAEGSLPVSEQLSREVLSLPMYPELQAAQQEYVVEQIARFYAGQSG